MSRYRKKSLADFAPYEPGLQPADGDSWVKLNTNESPFPPAPGVASAIARAAERLNLYPDPMQGDFRDAVGAALDIAADRVIGGNGGDELLAMAIRAFVPRGGRAAYLEPSYTLVPKLLVIHDVKSEEHTFADGYKLPSSFVKSSAPLKFVVNPNAPTGTLLPLDDIADLCARSKGVVVLDEAYVDFAPRSALAILDEFPNLLLVRSMSKSFSLAGLRVGFAIGGSDLMTDLWAVKDSYNLGRLPLAAATVALQDLDYWRSCVDQVTANRERLSDELRQRRYDVLPSASNFVFAVPPTSASDVYAALMQRRVLVRHFAEPSVAHGLRITVGTWDQCKALLEAIDQIAAA